MANKGLGGTSPHGPPSGTPVFLAATPSALEQEVRTKEGGAHKAQPEGSSKPGKHVHLKTQCKTEHEYFNFKF